MALTSSTGFRFRKSLYGGDLPAALRFRVANSITLKIGDAVRVNTGGFVALSGATAPVIGVCTGIVNNEGINPFSLGAGTAGATLIPDDSVTTAADNQTRAVSDGFIEAEVVVDPSGALLWYNDADGDLAVTDVLSLYDSLGGSDQINQGSADDTNGQWQLISVDPDGDDDASKGLFRIVEGELAVGVDQGNAKRAA